MARPHPLAGALAAEVRARVIAREQTIINRLIGKFRGDGLAANDALTGIASLAELRSLLTDLDRETRQGQEAQEKLLSGSALSTQDEEDT